MNDGDAPFHAHVYFSAGERAAAASLRESFQRLAGNDGERRILFVGRMVDRPVGPHPIPQFEIHFPQRTLVPVIDAIEASGLRALIHPLTDDDVADHTTLARWIGAPLELDISVLDPPGFNKGVARFGSSDF